MTTLDYCREEHPDLYQDAQLVCWEAYSQTLEEVRPALANRLIRQAFHSAGTEQRVRKKLRTLPSGINTLTNGEIANSVIESWHGVEEIEWEAASNMRLDTETALSEIAHEYGEEISLYLCGSITRNEILARRGLGHRHRDQLNAELEVARKRLVSLLSEYRR